MGIKLIYRHCKQLGCCDRCCFRFMNLKDSKTYENVQQYLAENKDDTITEEEPVNNGETKESELPPPKRQKCEICISCIGLLQEESWPEWFDAVKEVMVKKNYDCSKCAIAISPPLAITFREKAVCLKLKEDLPDFDENNVVGLKEAFRWSFATKLSSDINMELVSGDVSPLLFTLNFEYSDEQEELEVLRGLVPAPFDRMKKQRYRSCQFTRRPVTEAVDRLTLATVTKADGWADGVRRVVARVKCVSVASEHVPVYLGGRYIKLSRELPQTPWTVRGRRLMDTSIQEIIFAPIASAYGWTPEDAERRLKLMAAGREDVDVRCLGDGRPFAIEVTDPHRTLTDAEREKICAQIAEDGRVLVHRLVHIDKEALAELKKGEESKSKTYEALCIKLAHTDNGAVPSPVTEEDIDRINAFGSSEFEVHQRTPIRVLHRRPLLVRKRRVLEVRAWRVARHESLLVLRMRTSAGTYVKEWCHGEAGRTRPALADALQAPVDILSLDVVDVHLAWPPPPKEATK